MLGRNNKNKHNNKKRTTIREISLPVAGKPDMPEILLKAISEAPEDAVAIDMSPYNSWDGYYNNMLLAGYKDKDLKKIGHMKRYPLTKISQEVSESYIERNHTGARFFFTEYSYLKDEYLKKVQERKEQEIKRRDEAKKEWTTIDQIFPHVNPSSLYHAEEPEMTQNEEELQEEIDESIDEMYPEEVEQNIDVDQHIMINDSLPDNSNNIIIEEEKEVLPPHVKKQREREERENKKNNNITPSLSEAMEARLKELKQK